MSIADSYRDLRIANGVIPALAWCAIALSARAQDGQNQIDTTLEDYFQPGTQPDSTGLEVLPIADALINCGFCHGKFDEADPPLPPDSEPYRNWIGSMMAHSMRDPIYQACLTIANQDAAEAGDLCLRCHTPAGWLGGRSTPTDGSALIPGSADFDGVNCNFCHRLVSPVYEEGFSPTQDVPILESLVGDGLLPEQPGSGRYVVDPTDVRRGPFGLEGQDPFVGDPLIPYNPHFPIFSEDVPPIIWSQWHSTSDLCATCHDVNNPLYTKQPDGTYALNASDAAHPTMDPADMFPIERTYSEWKMSQFANGGVQLNGRFGGNHINNPAFIKNGTAGVMQSCQDCHMPDAVGRGCKVPGFPDRQNVPQHALNGGNTWVIQAIKWYYETVLLEPIINLDDQVVQDSIARVTDMLENASDLELTQKGRSLHTRITNYSGHKLPTGYSEGRQMWINVRFLDDTNNLVAEHGAYDFKTATLTRGNTKVYEARHAIDEAVAQQTGLPVHAEYHFALSNTILKDNRIPPIGFTNKGFESVQAEPVDVVYADGQHWDVTQYAIPACATQAIVTVYFQTTSKEYIEFLRDNNVTDGRGQLAYDLWAMFGKSAPVVMDSSVIVFEPFVSADIAPAGGDGVVGPADLAQLLAQWGRCKPMKSQSEYGPFSSGCAADLNCDGMVNAADLGALLANWG
jgi:hypothetical protein